MKPSLGEEVMATASPTERRKAQNNIDKARVALVLNHSFFASIVFRRRIDIEDATETAYVTQAGRIGVGTKFVAGLTVQETVFLLAHEAMHYALMHNYRRQCRDPKTWNVVCDYVINDLLVESRVGTPIENGAYRPGAREYAAEQLYQEQQDQGQGQPDYQPGVGNDDLSETELPEGKSPAEMAQEAAQEIVAATMAAKKQGNMPAGLARTVDEIVNPTTPWYQLLERYMELLVKADQSWRRPRKKMMAHELYLPSSDTKPAMGTVVIGVDTSGSVGAKEVAHFVGHINAILERCNPELVYVLHVDSRVHQADEFTPDDLPLVIKSFRGGGGTNMCKVLEWVDDEGVEPDVCIILTDGYTPYPDKAPIYPLVWLQTENRESPVGENIKYRMD